MKKIILVLILCATVLFITGCNERELQELQLSNEALESTVATLNEKIKGLEQELDKIKNGASYRLQQIRNQNNSGNDHNVLTLSDELNRLFAGSPEDIEAQGMANTIRLKQAEIERQRIAEQERRAAEAAISARDKARSIIRVTQVRTSRPNSAGGVDLYINRVNNSTKVIKYADFAVQAYNRVNDPVSCTIRQEGTMSVRSTGPFNRGQGNSGGTYWENLWYNHSITSARIVSISIEYMDNSTVRLTGDDINYVLY